MKIGEKVLTPDGPGIIIDLEKTDLVKRYIVKLDIKKYDFNPGYVPKMLEIRPQFCIMSHKKGKSDKCGFKFFVAFFIANEKFFLPGKNK